MMLSYLLSKILLDFVKGLHLTKFKLMHQIKLATSVAINVGQIEERNPTKFKLLHQIKLATSVAINVGYVEERNPTEFKTNASN